MDTLAMFPLESVLFPGMVLPLHVFEERYRVLVRRCVDAPPHEFGVALIERGSEVGGGDQRTEVGTVARIVQAEEQADGRWAVVAVGVRRIRIRRWLADDPHPVAEVEDWPDPPVAPGEDDALVAAYQATTVLLRRVLALAVELGEVARPLVELGDDPVAGSHHLCILAPLGALDRQGLLAAPGPAERLARLATLLEEEQAVLEAQLGGA